MSRRSSFHILTVIIISSLLAGAVSVRGQESASGTLGRIARSMTELGNYRQAAEELKPMLESSPDDAELHMTLAIAYYGLMEYEKAREHFTRAEELGPGSENIELVDYTLRVIYNNREVLADIERSKELLASESGPRELIIERMAAGHLSVLDRIVSREYYFPSVIMAHIIWLKRNIEYLPGIHTLSADIYYSGMFYEQAIEDYKKAIEEEPDNARLYRSLADSYVATGGFDEAQEHYRKALELLRREGSKSSLKEADRIERIKKALPRRYQDIAELIRLGRYQEAEEVCRRRISLNPADYAAITQMGQIYWKRGQRRTAIKLFRKAIRIAPDYPTAHLYLGKAYFFERKMKKGIAQFDIFREKMELLPDTDEDTQDFYISALNYIAYMYATSKDYDGAMDQYTRILEIDPEHQDAHYNIALCYYAGEHNRSRAYSYLKKAIELDSDSATARRAKYFIDYIRRNPDPRVVADLTFIYEE
ncbi:MAG: tetratricopeptide repeat protein [Candidatus Omnitrophica bacterium]|nr:tetratricopeptide repeat protein [Candidatus Omnitrophota bacterium]